MKFNILKVKLDFAKDTCIIFNMPFNMFKSPTETAGIQTPGSFDIRSHPLARLPEEDLNLIVELVLQSGSLKALAESYRVSYPTIRNRLDAVIERLKLAVSGKKPDPINDLLASLVERQQLSIDGARAIRDAVRQHAYGANNAPGGSES